MGCGSSSTSVRTFRNPEENKNYRSQKAPSRHLSATISIRSQKFETKEKTKRKSSASTSASVSSSRQQRKGDKGSREKSASSKKYSDVINNSIPFVPVTSHNENEHAENKTETNVIHFENDTEDINKIEEKNFEAKRHHEEIQKQTCNAGNK